ncbi:unnamed protein product [Caretta caretta]
MISWRGRTDGPVDRALVWDVGDLGPVYFVSDSLWGPDKLADSTSGQRQASSWSSLGLARGICSVEPGHAVPSACGFEDSGCALRWDRKEMNATHSVTRSLSLENANTTPARVCQTLYAPGSLMADSGVQ